MRISFQQLTSRWLKTIKTALEGRIIWLQNSRVDLSGEASDRPALVAVIGRQWYRERRKTYPVRSLSELRKVIRLEVAELGPTLFHIGPLQDEKRLVTLYELAADLDLEQLSAALLLPESRAVALSLMPGEIAVVENEDQPAYFVTADGISQQKGGALQSAELFSMAIGAQPPTAVLTLRSSDVRERLWPATRKVGLVEWVEAFNPALSKVAARLGPPIALATATMVLVYLLVASAYLTGMTTLRAYQIEQLGPEVNGLLDKQRRLESLATDYLGLTDLTNQTIATYKIWGMVTNVWQTGGSVSAISIVDGAGSLRGIAPVATDTLRGLSTEPTVLNPSFDAPVRQSGGTEEFVIGFTLARHGTQQP